jgi:hypothetical protein
VDEKLGVYRIALSTRRKGLKMNTYGISAINLMLHTFVGVDGGEKISLRSLGEERQPQVNLWFVEIDFQGGTISGGDRVGGKLSFEYGLGDPIQAVNRIVELARAMNIDVTKHIWVMYSEEYGNQFPPPTGTNKVFEKIGEKLREFCAEVNVVSAIEDPLNELK